MGSPASPYLAEACVVAVYLIYHHDGHVRKCVFIAIEVFCHRRFFSPPMCNVKVMVFDLAMKLLSSLAHILLATPPAGY